MSTNYSAVLDRLLNGENLAEEEAAALMHDLAAGNIDVALAGALLASLRAKGETADEIRGLANAMRELAVHPAIPDGIRAVDSVGTDSSTRSSTKSNNSRGL